MFVDEPTDEKAARVIHIHQYYGPVTHEHGPQTKVDAKNVGELNKNYVSGNYHHQDARYTGEPRLAAGDVEYDTVEQ